MRARILMVSSALIVLLFYLAVAGTGQLKGHITDQTTGEPVIGASIVLVGTHFGAQSDVDGKFQVLRIAPGTYSLKVSAIGYTSCLVESVLVVDGESCTQDIELIQSTADLDRTIEVRANTDAIDKFVTESKTTITGEAIKTKPVQNVPALLEQVAGVQSNQTGEVYIRGGRAGEVTYIVDGVSVGDPLGGLNSASPYTLPPATGGSATVNGEPYDAMFFKNAGVNPFVDTEDDHLSTFAADVDDASYILARSYLRGGNLPNRDAVRVEEFVNHFAYDYRPPTHEPFGVYIEGAPSRFGPKNSLLLRIGIKGKEVSERDRKPANLVFVVDISGSMSAGNRLELVKQSLRLLVDRLRPDDMIGIVVYDDNARALLESTEVRNRSAIVSVINPLHTAGATNAAEGIVLGYQMAARHLSWNRTNRVILCSDGVANVGTTGPDDILKLIDGYRQRGITLTTIGFGMGNFNDALMERLANRGDGVYAYVDDLQEARKLLVENLSGTLETIARDVKIQVDFDPETVRSYRLIGYENRDVADARFRDDQEDGGEIGAGHTTTALYEIKLRDQPRGDLVATIAIRYQAPEPGGRVTEINHRVTRRAFSGSFDRTTDDFKLAAAAAEFAEVLRESYWARDTKLSDILALARDVDRRRADPEVTEFVTLIDRAIELQQLSMEK